MPADNVRLFDRFDGSFVLSEDANAYTITGDGQGWITDVVTGEIRGAKLRDLYELAA